MKPPLDRPPLGWQSPARGFLIVLTGLLASAMAWASSGRDASLIIVSSLQVDANSAPASVLMALPGLGPALTGRIVEAREVTPFRSMDDFDRRVSGIGPAKVAMLRPFLRFDPKPLTPP